MTSIEEIGKNIEDATQRALRQLGVTEDQVEVEILEEGSKGFLGLGQAPARVRVTLKESPVSAPVQTVERDRQPARPRKPSAKKAVPAAETPAPKVEIAAPSEQAPISEEVLQKAAEISQEVLQKILNGLERGGRSVIKSTSDNHVVLDIVNGDTAILIGKHGQTIDALQYLVGVITSRRLSQKVRVIVDAEGYRARREEALRNQALYLAKKVKETGQEAVLESLHPNERRVIHTALANDPDVYTYSEGEDPGRHLVISPKS